MDLFRDELRAKESKESDLNLLHMLESRITEIVQIEKEVKQKYPKLFYQRLPRFMRRRAASHNVKRIPKFRRPKKIETKERKRLLAHRRKVRFVKHKRVLRKNQRHFYKDKNKSVLHKWFAKRFKIHRDGQIPLYNNTKNQRNLYRQTRYGCAYLSLAHLEAIKIEHACTGPLLDKLNRLTDSTSGYTFSARTLGSDRYEVVVHLFNSPELLENNSLMDCKPESIEYIGPSFVSNRKTHMIMWIPRNMDYSLISERYSDLKLSRIQPCDWTRIRLVGPNARSEAMRIAQDSLIHQQAALDVDSRLASCKQNDLTIGRSIEDKDATFTYFPTDPPSVDIVFRKKAGRMLWHQLIRNKAHLVGGWRDVNVLMSGKSFELIPDNMDRGRFMELMFERTQFERDLFSKKKTARPPQTKMKMMRRSKMRKRRKSTDHMIVDHS